MTFKRQGSPRSQKKRQSQWTIPWWPTGHEDSDLHSILHLENIELHGGTQKPFLFLCSLFTMQQSRGVWKMQHVCIFPHQSPSEIFVYNWKFWHKVKKSKQCCKTTPYTRKANYFLCRFISTNSKIHAPCWTVFFFFHFVFHWYISPLQHPAFFVFFYQMLTNGP